MTAIASTHTRHSSSGGPSGLLILFVACTLMPIALHAGGLLLSPTRILLLVCFVPAVFMVLGGKAGRVTPVDWLFLLHGVWMILALFYHHGTARLPFAGITMIEVLGGYFMGRLIIRDRIQFHWFLRLGLLFLIVTLPLTVHELITGKQLLNETLGKVFQTPLRGQSAYGRMGLERVYSVFDHPIHFGLFGAMLITNTFFMFTSQGAVGKAVVAAGFMVFITFSSLSSGPLLACTLQFLLMAWNAMMKGQWKLLAILFAIFYVLLDLASNRTPVTILIDTLTFNTGSAWMRIIIFDFGWAAVMNSPIFGIGFNDYPKPHWLTASVDNFWLLVAMRYGLVGAGLLVAAYVMHFRMAARASIGSETDNALRLGYLVTLFALSLSMVTVHVWGNLSVIIMFMIGAGAWLYTTDLSDGDAPKDDGTAARRRSSPTTVPSKTRYTRFGAGAQSAARTARPAMQTEAKAPLSAGAGHGRRPTVSTR